jgi:transposase
MTMENSILSSSPLRNHSAGDNWTTPVRAKVRVLRADGKSYGDIQKATGLARSTIQGIVKSKSSRTLRKGKATKPKLLKGRELRRILRYVSASWSNRRQSWSQLRAVLNIQASTTTLRRTLKAAGYRRCIACPRPFISRKQAQRRLAFAMQYRWWGTVDWKRVMWSDESTFETGKRGRIWVTRRPNEKHCQSCIKSVYRSGRVSVMIWGAIGWNYKSPLVFLIKEEDKRGITSKAYLNQVLEPVVFPYYISLSEEQKEGFIFMEDGAKVHVGDARLPKLNIGIRGLRWPPSSPDLNPIEKVWRWMKHELTKLPTPPLSIEDMKVELQKLWDRVNPVEWRYLTERITCKLEDVIAAKGMATIH